MPKRLLSAATKAAVVRLYQSTLSASPPMATTLSETLASYLAMTLTYYPSHLSCPFHMPHQKKYAAEAALSHDSKGY